MSHVIIGIIGVILFIGLAVAGAVYLGPKFVDSRIDAEAIGYLNQSSQISKAVEDYSSDRGRLPIEAGREPVEILVAEKYMKYAPEGGAAGWTLNSSTKSLITPVSGSGDRANKVCISARIKAKMPNPSTILKCDGSDAPGGALSPSDPCCLM
jgi:hypothetical protein